MFLDLIRKRRSTRKFKNRPVETDKIEILKEAALRSPSSRNLNPWEFIFVTDPYALEQLSLAKAHGSGFLKGAPLGIVVIADPSRCDVWIEDASVASTYLFLAAEDMGLGECWIQIRKRENSAGASSEEIVRKILKIPGHYRVESIIALGYADEEKTPVPKENLEWQKIHQDFY
jgi:nitroreductase